MGTNTLMMMTLKASLKVSVTSQEVKVDMYLRYSFKLEYRCEYKI
jgi:hypothetical protein